MKIFQYLLLGIAYLITISASAQWQWTDQDGRRVFSDRPPPIDIPDKNILQRPSARAAKKGTPEAILPPTLTAVPVSAPQSAGATLKLSGIDKELAANKKKADEAQAAKSKTEQEDNRKVRAESCSRAKQAKASLDSGMRIGRTNEKGEHEVLDDAGRAAEIKRIQAIVDTDCK